MKYDLEIVRLVQACVPHQLFGNSLLYLVGLRHVFDWQQSCALPVEFDQIGNPCPRLPPAVICNGIWFSAKITSMARQTSSPTKPQDDQTSGQPKVTGQSSPDAPDSTVGGGREVKEREAVVSREEEDKIMAEITTRAEVADRQMEAQVLESFPEARRPVPEPKMAPDVEDAGVVHPQTEAEKVVTRGPTLDLPISEQTYKQGLHLKIAGAVVNKAVVGVSSLAALAMWIGRLIKMAHKHTMKVVFRRAN